MAITLQSPSLRIQATPEFGGRITSLVDRDLGDEWLYPPQHSSGIERPFCYASGPRGGMDECLPSITACQHPDPAWAAREVPDHGDFWWRAWEVRESTPLRLVLHAGDQGNPLSLTRAIVLDPKEPLMRLHYELKNTSSHDYAYLYSAHPLFAFEGNAEIEVPGTPDVVASFGPSLVPGHQSKWPHAGNPSGHLRRLDHVAKVGPTENYKVFVRSTGWCTLATAPRGRKLRLEFDHETFPWLGICVNRGAWPHPDRGESWIAIEPTTSPTDDLPSAVRAGQARNLAPGQVARWLFSMRLEDGPTFERSHEENPYA